MTRFSIAAAFMGAIMLTAAPAAAQSSEKVTGPYVVARAGVAADTDAKLRENGAALGSLSRESDFKPGFTGEIGGGYDFGGFRLEGTVGYTNAKLDRERQGNVGADGRIRSVKLGIAGYVDIPVSDSVVPYVGAGIGASRVRTSLLRPGPTVAQDTRFAGRDWGLHFHVDAGLGIRLAPRTTLEIGARYMRTTKLEYDGGIGPSAQDFKPRLSSVSAMAGIRQVF